jgi:uracil-DNA glycosylase
MATQLPAYRTYGEGKNSLKVNGQATVAAYQTHRLIWERCTNCAIGKHCLPPKGNHVFFRGTVPCDILFIGEAPGPEEDVTGFPFSGRAGNCLNALIDEVRIHLRTKFLTRMYGIKPSSFKFAITNTVACIPNARIEGLEDLDDVDIPNLRKPTKEEVENCSHRLLSELDIAAPRGIILLGKIAESVAPTLDGFPFRRLAVPEPLSVYHPSYLQRKGCKSSTDFARVAISIANFIGQVYNPPKPIRSK